MSRPSTSEEAIKAGTDGAFSKVFWNSPINQNKVAGFPSKFDLDWDAICPSRAKKRKATCAT